MSDHMSMTHEPHDRSASLHYSCPSGGQSTLCNNGESVIQILFWTLEALQHAGRIARVTLQLYAKYQIYIYYRDLIYIERSR